MDIYAVLLSVNNFSLEFSSAVLLKWEEWPVRCIRIGDVKLRLVQSSCNWPFNSLVIIVLGPETAAHKCNELGLDKAKSIAMAINNTAISVLAELVNQTN